MNKKARRGNRKEKPGASVQLGAGSKKVATGVTEAPPEGDTAPSDQPPAGAEDAESSVCCEPRDP